VNEVAVPLPFWAVRDGHGVGGTRPFSPACRTSTQGAKRNTNNNDRSGRSRMKVAVGHRKQKERRVRNDVAEYS
jgi:hypothetical protein